jgi:type VI protein secretion system component Hcp
MVGNRAVSAMLARQPTEEKAATMTAGLGDDIGVIPIDSFSWGGTGTPGGVGKGHAEVHEVSLSFGLNLAAAAISQAVAEGKHIPAAFLSTSKMTIDFTDVLLANYSQNERGITVTLNFADMKFRE